MLHACRHPSLLRSSSSALYVHLPTASMPYNTCSHSQTAGHLHHGQSTSHRPGRRLSFRQCSGRGRNSRCVCVCCVSALICSGVSGRVHAFVCCMCMSECVLVCVCVCVCVRKAMVISVYTFPVPLSVHAHVCGCVTPVPSGSVVPSVVVT